MLIKYSQKRPWLLIIGEYIWDKRTIRILALLLFAGLVFACGIYFDRSQYFNTFLKPIIQNATAVARNVKTTLIKPEMEQITIDIKHEDYMKLAYQREVALAGGMLSSVTKEFVPAVIRHEDKSIKVKLRLKGDWTDHLQGDKWSFRIDVKGENTLFGMEEFSIQHPRLRNYLYEWLYHQALKREGVLSLRYKFINVTLNGKDLGVYAVEEQFDKRLIEHNELREGPIVKFNENLLWEERLQQSRLFPDAETKSDGFYAISDIDAFQTNKIVSDPASYVKYTKAVYLLESFRRGKLKTSEVFDVEKLAKHLAITDLMGAEHALFWHNLRFYYNPVTSRLEPIGFDGNPAKHPLQSLTPVREGYGSSAEPDGFYAMIFSDPVFFREYVRNLERISEPSYLDSLFAELNEELEKNLDIIHSEFPYFDFSRKILYQNQTYIRTVLNPIKGLNAYYHGFSENRVELELGNIHSMPLEVWNVTYRDSLALRPVEETILPARVGDGPVDYRIVSFALPENLAWSDTMKKALKLNYKLIGASQPKYETVFPWSYLDDSFSKTDILRQKPNAEEFAFLVTDEAAGKIFIKPGSWNIDRNLVIPKGYRIIAGENTSLNLINSAVIISYSALEFIGSQDYPVVIQSKDSSAQGLVVMNAGQPSILDYVIFDNLSNPAQRGWTLTGAVNFYESPVRISNSQFVANRSEDGLNIIRSEYTIDGTLFSRTQADAFDADFTNGKITNCSFVELGNDAIDVSGSVLSVQNVTINGAGDKGLSAGENSQMTASQVDIKDASIAIASKDLTHVTLENVKISGGQVGITVYRKKPEFGPASITAEGLEMEGVEVPYLVEQRSTVVVNKRTIEPNREKVEDILYGVEYGKASKR